MDLWENENDEDHAMYLGEMSVWTQEYNDSIIKKIEEMERDELNLEHYAALRDNAKLKKYIKSHCSEKYNAKDIMKGITAAEDKKIKRTSLEKGNPEIEKTVTESIIINLFNDADGGNIDNTYYSEVYGFSKNITTYRDFTHLYAKIFFNFLDDLKLDYYVFAGTSVGYIRNKQNIPWVDDYDIMIFEEEFDNFENNIIPKLVELGFNCFKPGNPLYAGCHILSEFGQKCFQCDVFFSVINDNGIVKNNKEWGLYTIHNVTIDMVRPKKYLTIDNNLTLPFFNDMSKDIEIEYGNVFDTCIININHEDGCKINQHFTKVYDSFNYVKNRIINNAKNLFVEHEYNKIETHYDYDKFINQFQFGENEVLNHIAVLKYIKDKNIKIWNIKNERFLIFCPDIKYYFEHITINFYLGKIEKKNLILLNYVDNIFYSKKKYIDNIQKEIDIMVLNKPKKYFKCTKK